MFLHDLKKTTMLVGIYVKFKDLSLFFFSCATITITRKTFFSCGAITISRKLFAPEFTAKK